MPSNKVAIFSPPHEKMPACLVVRACDGRRRGGPLADLLVRNVRFSTPLICPASVSAAVRLVKVDSRCALSLEKLI